MVLFKREPPTNCIDCGGKFSPWTKKHKRCQECAKVTNYNKIYREKMTYGYEGAYVYGWYRQGEALPFYIGKGKNGRAWRRGCPPNTEIRIYRDRLTDEGAFLVESVLINVFKTLGAPLVNQKAGIIRAEKPPLKLT